MGEISEIQRIILLALPLLIAVTFHELAHGYVADRFGDPTARLAGRLTFNPLKHLDIVGTLVFIITGMIGWAKPVPVDPYNLHNPRKDMMWIALAGPAANIGLAVIFSFILRLLNILPFETFSPFVVNNILFPLSHMIYMGVVLNIGLAVFNTLPVPPLDGSNILMGLLSEKHAAAYHKISPYGFIILLVLIFSGFTGHVIRPVIKAILKLLLN
jgi:Zn-dependent protease